MGGESQSLISFSGDWVDWLAADWPNGSSGRVAPADARPDASVALDARIVGRAGDSQSLWLRNTSAFLAERHDSDGGTLGIVTLAAAPLNGRPFAGAVDGTDWFVAWSDAANSLSVRHVFRDGGLGPVLSVQVNGAVDAIAVSANAQGAALVAWSDPASAQLYGAIAGTSIGFAVPAPSYSTAPTVASLGDRWVVMWVKDGGLEWFWIEGDGTRTGTFSVVRTGGSFSSPTVACGPEDCLASWVSGVSGNWDLAALQLFADERLGRDFFLVAGPNAELNPRLVWLGPDTWRLAFSRYEPSVAVPRLVIVDVSMSDAGQPVDAGIQFDGGGADGGWPAPRTFEVGCGCGAAPWPGLILLVLTRRRRARRPQLVERHETVAKYDRAKGMAKVQRQPGYDPKTRAHCVSMDPQVDAPIKAQAMRKPRLVLLVASLVLAGCAAQVGSGSSGRDGGDPEDGGAPGAAADGGKDGGQPATSILGLGDGGEAGSLVGYLWTPGRDDAGVVNATSWNLVPVESWVEVQNTRLDALDSVIKATIPTWRDFGTEGWSGVANDWSGLTIDQRGNRVWLAGGGHAGSSNNGLYRFDFFRMKWSIEDLPSDPASWSAEYKATGAQGGSFTKNPEAAAEYDLRRDAGTLSPINDWYVDELPADRKPTSRHTYSFMVYADRHGEVVSMCRRLWRYSIAQGRWVYKRLIRDQAAPEYMGGENGVAIYDEVTDEVLVSSAGSSGIYRATGYHLGTNAWTPWTSPWNYYSNIADVRLNREVVVVSPPSKAAVYGGSLGRYWQYDLDQRALTSSGTFQFSVGLSQDDFAADNAFYDSAALVYLPNEGRYWLFTQMADRSGSMIWIDPRTQPWTIGPRVSFTDFAPAFSIRMERKLVHMEGLRAILLVNQANQNIYLYRLE